MRLPEYLGLVYWTLISGVLANPLLWCTPSERSHLQHQLLNLHQNVNNAIYDIDRALNGQYPSFISQLVDLLGDTRSS
jgi:hypothetical protein